MSLETLQVMDAAPLLNLYDAICKLRECNAPEMNDNMDGIVEIEYDIDMRSDKMVSCTCSFSTCIDMYAYNYRLSTETHESSLRFSLVCISCNICIFRLRRKLNITSQEA